MLMASTLRAWLSPHVHQWVEAQVPLNKTGQRPGCICPHKCTSLFSRSIQGGQHLPFTNVSRPSTEAKARVQIMRATTFLSLAATCQVPVVMPVTLSTQEAEIRRVTVRSQPGQIVLETLCRKNPSQKRTGRVAQGVGPEFKPQYCKKKKRAATWESMGRG
jgi:hypothetical protein